MKKLIHNKPEFKPRLEASKIKATHPTRNPNKEGEVELTDKEKFEKKKEENAKEEIEQKVDLQNPGFDPDLPEQKQRWLR